MGYSDFVRNTAGASGGQMLVRVADGAGQPGVISGNDIMFYVRSGLSATWIGSPGYGTRVYANGGWIQLANIANHSNNTNWVYVGKINVLTNQTITFHIDGTGTQGFGGPDDFPVSIIRANVPAAPTPIGAGKIQHIDFEYQFSGNSDGGAPIIEWQVGYGYDPNTPTWTAPSWGTITLGPFVVGSRVYVWARGRNLAGWGPWSLRTTVDLRRGCLVKTPTGLMTAIPFVKTGKVPEGSLGIWSPSEPYLKTGKVIGGSNGTWKLAAYTG